ncbi:MAG: hypothetical protein KDB14_16460 [Planctomycetales bacterium]|nr:hypothetical protein [Planctomycetales bacterium]
MARGQLDGGGGTGGGGGDSIEFVVVGASVGLAGGGSTLLPPHPASAAAHNAINIKVSRIEFACCLSLDFSDNRRLRRSGLPTIGIAERKDIAGCGPAITR